MAHDDREAQRPHFHSVHVTLGTGHSRVRGIRVWHAGDREAQRPHFHSVRVTLGTGHSRVRGIGRAGRTGGVSHPEFVLVPIRTKVTACRPAPCTHAPTPSWPCEPRGTAASHLPAPLYGGRCRRWVPTSWRSAPRTWSRRPCSTCGGMYPPAPCTTPCAGGAPPVEF